MSKKFAVAIGLVCLIFGYQIFKHKKNPAAQSSQSGGQAEDRLLHSATYSPESLPKSLKMNFTLPANPQLLSDVGRKPKAIIAHRTKVRLNLGLLMKSPAFRKANPHLNLADFQAGKIDPKSIIIPKGTGLSAELNPECKGQYQWIDNQKLTVREQENLAIGLPVFLSYKQNADQSLQQVSDSMETNRCVFNVGLNDSMVMNKLGKSDEEKSEFAEKAKADKTLTEAIMKAAVAAGTTPRMAVVGSVSDLKEYDPSLLTNDGQKRMATKVNYNLSSQDKSVELSRLAFPVRNSHSASDAAISNAIVRAAMSGANIINVVRPQYDSVNFQAAVAIAEKRGAVVVSRVPVRSPASKSR